VIKPRVFTPTTRIRRFKRRVSFYRIVDIRRVVPYDNSDSKLKIVISEGCRPVGAAICADRKRKIEQTQTENASLTAFLLCLFFFLRYPSLLF